MATLKYYKIVQTNENGNLILSPVPQHWENGGKLSWPSDEKIAAKAMKKPWSTLPGDDWIQYDCVLKRNYIWSYAQALKELEEMTNKSESSECEASKLLTVVSQKRTAGAKKFCPNPDDNRFNFNEQVICFFISISRNIFSYDFIYL